MPIKQKILLVITFILLFYLSSYFYIRRTRAEVWEKDNQVYVIFPADKVYLYYFYRPLSYIDGTLTEVRFHIGQHQ